MPPVVAVGKTIKEKATGKVVAHARSRAKAKAYARIRNQKHREKMERKGA